MFGELLLFASLFCNLRLLKFDVNRSGCVASVSAQTVLMVKMVVKERENTDKTGAKRYLGSATESRQNRNSTLRPDAWSVDPVSDLLFRSPLLHPSSRVLGLPRESFGACFLRL